MDTFCLNILHAVWMFYVVFFYFTPRADRWFYLAVEVKGRGGASGPFVRLCPAPDSSCDEWIYHVFLMGSFWMATMFAELEHSRYLKPGAHFCDLCPILQAWGRGWIWVMASLSIRWSWWFLILSWSLNEITYMETDLSVQRF
jgi:hypothetical protein